MEKRDSLLYFDLNIGQNYLSDWDTSFAIREVIANALDEQIDGNIEAELSKDGVIIIRDWGPGLKPEHLVYQEFNKKNSTGKIGKFGVGLKDAIGVLYSRSKKVEIKARGYRITFAMQEKHAGSSCKTLHAIIKEINNDDFVGTEIKIYDCSSNDFEKAKQQFVKFQSLKVLHNSFKGEIIDKEISEPASIYVNGMKIAEDHKLRFSYNIKNPSSKVLKGINRERNYVSRTVYQSDIVKILEQVKDAAVLDVLEDQLVRTFDNENLSEVSWKDVVIKTCNYVIKKNDVVFISNEDIEKSSEAYNLICQNRAIKVFKVSPKVKQILETNLEKLEKTKIFLEDFEVDIDGTISIDELTKNEKNVLKNAIKVLKRINVVKSEYYLLDDLHISKETKAYMDQTRNTIIIPRACLKSVEDCSCNLINALASIREGSNKFKDCVIGELCSEFLQKIGEDDID